MSCGACLRTKVAVLIPLASTRAGFGPHVFDFNLRARKSGE
jgi:hypothetical protein